MNFWMLWKSGPDREADGALATHLVAATDSLEALFRRGERLAEHHGLAGLKSAHRRERRAATDELQEFAT